MNNITLTMFVVVLKDTEGGIFCRIPHTEKIRATLYRYQLETDLTVDEICGYDRIRIKGSPYHPYEKDIDLDTGAVIIWIKDKYISAESAEEFENKLEKDGWIKDDAYSS